MTQAFYELIMALVPQWMGCNKQHGNETIQIDGSDVPFIALRPISLTLQSFKDIVETGCPKWVRWLSENHLPSVPIIIQEGLAIEWLKVLAPSVDWHKALAYTTTLSNLTFENAAITANLVISQEEQGTVDIANPSLSKLIATLGTSMHSFLRVDRNLRLIDFETIPWAEVTDIHNYKLYPEFLHPFNSVLESSDFSIHHTARGDLLVMRRGGLCAARRKGQWRIYEPAVLKDITGDILNNYQVGANTFELLLDLSFKRHGALLVYDPQKVTLGHVVNTKSIVAETHTNYRDPLRDAINRSVEGVTMGRENGLARKKRLIMELASMDGAVIFDDEKILAIGAMLATHPNAGDHVGARTTAALSALAYGAHPIKVSADGDIELYFSESNRWGIETSRSLSFL